MKCVVPAVLLLAVAAQAHGAPVQMGGISSELTLSQVTPHTVRLDLVPLDSSGKPLPAPASTVLMPLEQSQKLKVRNTTEFPAQPLQVGDMTVAFSVSPLVLEFRRADGQAVQKLEFRDVDGSVTFDTPGPTFGLGEGRQQLDRRGFYYDFQNGQNQFLASHGATVPVPYLMGIKAATGAPTQPMLWGMFIHNPALVTDNARANNTAWGQFDLRGDGGWPAPLPARDRPPTPPGSREGIVAPPVPNSLNPPATLPTRGRYNPQPSSVGKVPLSIFIMSAPTGAEMLAEYTHLVGNAAMPPKWVLGYMQSHRSLESAEEVMAVAKRFRDEKLPCDALIYLGTGYTNATQANRPFGGWNTGHGSLTFNPLIFPDPKGALDQLHGMNYKVILHKNAPPPNLHGTVNDAAEPGDRTAVANDWPTHTPLVKMGVDGWWPDDGDDLGVENRLAHIRMYYDGMVRDRPDERPWSLDRNGYAGVAKYGGWNWSGDVRSTWATLQHHVAVGLNSSMSLSPWWGTDIGGFNGAPEYSGELYVRWFQFGAFNPLFRSHGRNWRLHTPFGWNDGTAGPNETTQPANADLKDPRILAACREALELRYALLPYNYSVAREACDTGMPMMRALWLDNPGDQSVRNIGDEYLWGPNLLVAPVLEAGAQARLLYLPKGDWYDWSTLTSSRGERFITLPVNLNTIPLFVRAGAVVPLDPVRQYTAEPVTTPTTLKVFPGADSTFVLYDDDGHSQKYQDRGDDQTQWIRLTWRDATRTLTLEPAIPAATHFYGGPQAPAARKAWPAGFKRLFSIDVVGQAAAARRIEYAGEKIESRMN